MIKNYFLNYHLQDVDITINTKTGAVIEHQDNDEEWEVTLVDTGLECMTGARVARVARHIDTPTFMVTYGDGLANVNIEELLKFHKLHKKHATLTCVRNNFRFGNLKLENNKVVEFLEKKHFAKDEQWINGGFFVFNKEFLNYISEEPGCILEQKPLVSVALDGQLMAYRHEDFWYCMDTLRDHEKLQEIWESNNVPWKIWSSSQKFKPASSARNTISMQYKNEPATTNL